MGARCSPANAEPDWKHPSMTIEIFFSGALRAEWINPTPKSGGSDIANDPTSQSSPALLLIGVVGGLIPHTPLRKLHSTIVTRLQRRVFQTSSTGERQQHRLLQAHRRRPERSFGLGSNSFWAALSLSVAPLRCHSSRAVRSSVVMPLHVAAGH
jgi:hypothetical protein